MAELFDLRTKLEAARKALEEISTVYETKEGMRVKANLALAATAPEAEATHPGSERLDWLESNPTNFGDIENKSAFPDEKWRIWSNGQEAGALGVGKTLRDAIDVARKEKP